MSRTSRKLGSAPTAHCSNRGYCLLAVLMAISTLLPAGRLSGAAEIRQEQATVAVTYHAGWNLVGVPDGTVIAGTVGGILALIAGSTSYASATADDSLVGGQGYWAYFATETHIDLPSTPLAGLAKISTDGGWTMIGNPSTQPVRLSGADTAYGFDPLQGFGAVDLLAPGRGALVYSSAPTTLTLMAAPDTIRSFTPPGAAAATATPAPSVAAVTGLQMLASGFGQTKAGAAVAVAVLIRNNGAPADLIPVSITVFDAGGAVIAAGDVTLHYVGAGQVTGLVHRLSIAGSASAARVDVQAGDGRPAGDAPPGSLAFSQTSIVPARGGLEATAVLASSFATDLAAVHVNALAYDSAGRLVGGGETIKRLVPAGGSVGVVVSLEVSGTPARVDFYAQLP